MAFAASSKQADRGVSLDAQRAKAKAYAELYDFELSEETARAGPLVLMLVKNFGS